MDAAVLCWDLATSTPVQSIYEHSHWVTAIVSLNAAHESLLSSVGFATGGMDTHVRVFTRASDAQFACVAVLQGHTSGVISLSWLQTDTTSLLLSGSWDGTCRGWDVATQTCRFVLPDHENGVCVLGLPNGVVITGSTGKQQGNQVVDARIRMWHQVSPSAYELTRTLTDHQGGAFATGAEDKQVRVFSSSPSPLNDALEAALAAQVAEAHVQAYVH
ncbi:hypothetical protein DYB37_011774 [Aphanomyces astaci]|uniref:Uncharacterized protein n=2 Tax=Aphanomyces astaci TaxID=112090 RepID=A0A396ZSB3_APHAT|nr:hypothetical protein DYB25_006627 [Aphanomyces astaci]RHY03142.1 hypothetical protein DYB36_011222 [Aphanomyces astaci]RHY75437.1 hypothetical protein DYB34_009934 [Aphanomyces astaci]RHY90362.1 hypothetical protein DYB35_011564 [Aphanomyces astaci]RHZ30322.1 hypothetical protein DYB37_011774 [Aphanomyces astaci]